MKINVARHKVLLSRPRVGIFFAFKDRPLPKELAERNKALKGAITVAASEEKFQGKDYEMLWINNIAGLEFSRILLVGLGKYDLCDHLQMQKSSGAATRFLLKKKIKKAAVVLPDALIKKHSAKKLAESFALGALLAEYKFDEYKTEEKYANGEIQEIVLIGNANLNDLEKGAQNGKIIAEAANYARDYGNQPANKATPEYLAKMAMEISKIPKVSCKVLGKDKIKKLKMGAFLGVTQGSKRPPKFIILEYRGNPRKKDWLVFVGKGITFDSGGISIKPSDKMDEMKYDMAGGGAVMEAIEAIAKLKLSVNVAGLIPAVENLLSGESLMPGDILVSASGKTIEVVNTDAEGRLVLADALHYAKAYKPKAVIDLATLTGSCYMALGRHACGLLGNNEKLIAKVKQAGKHSGERVWELPLWKDYYDEIKSDIADLKNISNYGAGTITAAAFLSKFIEGYPWVHLDIAETARIREESPYMAKGATGFGVALLVELARAWKM